MSKIKSVGKDKSQIFITTTLAQIVNDDDNNNDSDTDMKNNNVGYINSMPTIVLTIKVQKLSAVSGNY